MNVRTAVAIRRYAGARAQQQNAKAVITLPEYHFPRALIRDLGQPAEQRAGFRCERPSTPLLHQAGTSLKSNSALEYGKLDFFPSGVEPAGCALKLTTSECLTPNTASESRYASPSTNKWVATRSYPGALAMTCTWAGR